MKLFRIFILAIFATSLVACGGAEERKAVYLEKAKASMEAGDLDKARIELKNVLQIDPKDAEAYYQLGKVFEQQGDYRKAFSHYLRAEELNPELLENQAKLGRIYLLLANQSDKAQEKIDFILAKDPENEAGLLLKAVMLVKNKNKSKAIKVTENILLKNPGYVDGAIYLAKLYASKDNFSDAIIVLDSALKINPDNEALNKYLASILVSNKDYSRAEVLYEGFLERNPDSVSSYNNLAAFYNKTGDKAKAEKILRMSIDNATDDIDRKITLVKYIKAIKGEKDAIAELETMIQENAGVGELRTVLAELLYVGGDRQSAIDVYNQAINDFPEEVTGVESRISLAIIYLSDQDYESANKVINDAYNVSPNDPKVNFLKAKLALHNKNYEQAIISLRIVTKEMPENVEAFLLLASVYKLKKNEEQYNSVLYSAYDNNKTNADGLLMLAKYYLSRDVSQAEKIIDDYNNLKESDYKGLSIKAAILNQNNAQLEAFKIAKKLMEDYPEKPNGYIQAMPYYVQQTDKDEAVSVLEKGYRNTKGDRKLLSLLTSLQISEKQYDVVLNRIEKALESSPKDVELNLLLAKVYMSRGSVDMAESTLLKVVDLKPSSEEPYLLLSQVYLRKGEPGAAESILSKGTANIANSIKIPLRLAAIYESENNYKKAIDAYRSINQKYPDNLLVINNLASTLSDHSNNPDDLELAKTLIEKLKEREQPVFLDTVGWVYYKLGDYERAVQYLTQAVKKAPEINVFNYHLGMAYKMSGDKAQAKTYLEKSLANGKKFKEKESAKAALKEL